MNTNEEENNSGTTNTIQTLVYFSLGYLIGLSAEEYNSGTTNTIQTLVHFSLGYLIGLSVVMFVGLATFFSIIFLKRIGRGIICTCTCNLSNQDYLEYEV